MEAMITTRSGFCNIGQEVVQKRSIYQCVGTMSHLQLIVVLPSVLKLKSNYGILRGDVSYVCQGARFLSMLYPVIVNNSLTHLFETNVEPHTGYSSADCYISLSAMGVCALFGNGNHLSN
jgi:hypothetical protein